MASTEGPARAHDSHARRRPFASWMKRLANLKNLHAVDSGPSGVQKSTDAGIKGMKGKKIITTKHSPYTFHSPSQRSRSRRSSLTHSKNSMAISNDNQAHPKSRAPTLATTAETTVSGAGTTTTAARTEGDRDSTFSSPSPSLRSVTTTLTTIQSTAAGVNQGNHPPLVAATSLYTAQPAPALPAHLAPANHPATYHSATANNLLSDNASMLTLASSSKRGRRRNSVDTNASVKALAPASMFGGSRESLPLSVLSGTIINPVAYADNASFRDTASSHYPRSTMNAERASLISASGVTAPALASERNSYIGSNKHTGDAGSVRSGLLGLSGDRDGTSSRAERLPLHGRNDSLGAGSIGASSLMREMVTAPSSPMPV